MDTSQCVEIWRCLRPAGTEQFLQPTDRAEAGSSLTEIRPHPRGRRRKGRARCWIVVCTPSAPATNGSHDGQVAGRQLAMFRWSVVFHAPLIIPEGGFVRLCLKKRPCPRKESLPMNLVKNSTTCFLPGVHVWGPARKFAVLLGNGRLESPRRHSGRGGHRRLCRRRVLQASAA